MVDRLKWLFTFTLLLITVGWGVFTILVVRNGFEQPTPANVLEASGASVITGVLVSQLNNVVQFWFRKKSPDEPTKKDST